MLRLGEWKGLRLSPSPRRWSPLLRRARLDPPPPWRELERDLRDGDRRRAGPLKREGRGRAFNEVTSAAARPTEFACVPSIVSGPGPALALGPAPWSASASCRVAARTPTSCPASRTGSGASTSTASVTSARPCPRARAWRGATARRSETRSGTRSGRTRRRRASGWRTSVVSWGKQRHAVREDSQEET